MAFVPVPAPISRVQVGVTPPEVTNSTSRSSGSPVSQGSVPRRSSHSMRGAASGYEFSPDMRCLEALPAGQNDGRFCHQQLNKSVDGCDRLLCSSMYDREKMNKALRVFDQSTVLSLLPDESSDTVRELLGDISRSGCLIRLYALTPEQEEHRAQMINWLNALTKKRAKESGYVKFLLDEVARITELTLAEIESSLKDDLFSTLPIDQQAWSALEWAGREMLSVQRQMEEGRRERSEGDQVIIDPLNLRVDKEHGYGLAAGRLTSSQRRLRTRCACSVIEMAGELLDRSQFHRESKPQTRILMRRLGYRG